MRSVPLAFLSLIGALISATAVSAGPPVPWTLPRDREVYLMEDDLVYARFLTLARGGTYCQINRVEHVSAEVDRGEWAQDATGTVRLHSSCHALRPRALSSGPLSVTLNGEHAFEDLPLLLDSVRRFLAANRDDVFDARTTAEWNRPGTTAVHVAQAAATFERRDAVALVARLEAALASERDAIYFLEPVPGVSGALFTLRGSVFGVADLVRVRRAYRVADGATPPFYFARVEAKTYAAEVGRWQPLRLPGGGQ